MAGGVPLEDAQDLTLGLLGGGLRSIHLIDAPAPLHGLLGDEVDGLRLDVLPDLRRGPAASLESLSEDEGPASQDDHRVGGEEVGEVRVEERHLRLSLERPSEGLDVDLVWIFLFTVVYLV